MKRPLMSFCPRRYATIVVWVALTSAATGTQALIVVNQPWVRPAPAGHSTEAYMNLTSTEDATLIAVRSGSAAAVTLHGRENRAGAFNELALPAGAIVELAPGKDRFSLRRLAKAVKLGDIVPLTLTIRGSDGARQDIAVSAVARLRSPVDDERRAHRHRHHDAEP